MPIAKHLFLSFNSQDRDKVRVVHTYLTQRGVATFLDERNLLVGRNWPKALEQALNDASAVAVFVGSRTGRWQRNEIGFALDRQAGDERFPVIPVLLDGADASRSFLFLNTWIDLRGERLHDAKALGRLIDAVAGTGADEPGALLDINPYRGLEYFDEDHAPFFFGRESFIEDLFSRLTAQRKKFVAVIGASGSGKSSVVRAGLIPKLRRQRPPQPTWDVAVFTPGERPWFRLADTLGPLRFPDKSDTDLDIEIDKLARALQSGELALESVLDRIMQSQGKLHRLLLVVDQFEELFTLTPKTERTPFVDRLVASLAVEGLVLVPTLRADFYGQAIEANRELSDLLGREQLTLGRLTEKELNRVIVEPAKLARLELDPGLPELLLRDAGNEPGNLPLLQYALLELYSRRTGNRLASEAYRDIGGIRKAIANTAEREFARFAAEGKANVVRSVFTQLVRLARVDEGLEDTRRRLATARLSPDARGIVDEFAGPAYRLLVKTSERHAGNQQSAVQAAASEQETVEVAHEALIREWKRLQDWLNEDRGFYLWRQRLDQAIEEYNKQDRTSEYLLTGPALKEAEGKLASPKPEPLTHQQAQFIDTSIEERDRIAREALEAEQRRRDEKEALEARERKALKDAAEQAQRAQLVAEAAKRAEERLRKTAEHARIEAIASQRDAEEQRKLAVAQTLSLRSNRAAGLGDYCIACLLSALALKIAPSSQEAKDSAIMLLAGQELRGKPLRGHSSAISSVALTSDGTRIFSASWDKTVRAWDGETGHAIGVPLHAHAGAVTSVAVSKDGLRMISVGDDKTLRLWDAKTRGLIGKPMRGHSDWVSCVAASSDGLLIVSGSGDATLRMWDGTTGQMIGEPLCGHDGAVYSVALSNDNQFIVSGGMDKTVRLWDVRKGALIGQPLRGHTRAVCCVAISTDGARIVSGSRDYTLRLWDSRTGRSIGEPLQGHEGAILCTSFSADGDQVISCGEDATLRLWDAKTGRAIGPPVRGHEGTVYSVAISADSERIVSGGDDWTLRVWTRRNARPMGEPLRGHREAVTSVVFSGDSSRIVSASKDLTLRVWDGKTGRAVGKLSGGHEFYVTSVACSSNGEVVVSGSQDGTLRLWSCETGLPIGEPLRRHKAEVTGVAMSPDGERIVSASSDLTLRLWDVKTGRSKNALRGHEGFVLGVSFSPDGTRIVSCSEDNTLMLWDIRAAQPVGVPLRGHESGVLHVAFSADGQRIVSASRDKTLRLWDVESAQPIGSPLRGHPAPATGVAFSPEGTRIISGSEDGTLRIWSAVTGQSIGMPIHAHLGRITSVAFSPDGERIATASEDSTLRLWDARLLESADDLRELLCGTLSHNFTREQWRQYVPQSEHFQAICEHLPIESP